MFANLVSFNLNTCKLLGRGLAPAAAIKMSDSQYELLLSETKKRSLANGIKMRITILLEASQGKANGRIATELGIGKKRVRYWRRRWEVGYQEILAFEKGSSKEGVSDKALLEKILHCVKDAPRKGSPEKSALKERKRLLHLLVKNQKNMGLKFQNGVIICWLKRL